MTRKAGAAIAPSKPPAVLSVGAQYLTPRGRVCRLVRLTPRSAQQASEASFVYIGAQEAETQRSACRLLPDGFDMPTALAARCLVRVS